MAGRRRLGKILVRGPLVRTEQPWERLRPGVDQDEPGNLVGVGAGIEPREQAAERMGHQHVRRRDARGFEQPVQLADDRVGGSGHRHPIALAAMRRVENRARAIVGADPREAGEGRHDHGLPGFTLDRPDFGSVAIAGDQNDDRAAGATAFQEDPARADLDESGELAVGGNRLGVPRRRRAEHEGQGD